MSKFMLLQTSAESREQLREQIRQTVKDAQTAAEQAAQDAGKARAEQIKVFGVPNVPGLPGVPGVGIQIGNDTIPPQVESISIAFFIMVAAIIIGLPLMRAIARRIERGTPMAAPIPAEVRNQLQQISQSVDAIAIEVERISEGQRFTTKMLAERAGESELLRTRQVAPGKEG